MKKLNEQTPLQPPLCSTCSEGGVYSKEPETGKVYVTRKMLQVAPKRELALRQRVGSVGTGETASG